MSSNLSTERLGANRMWRYHVRKNEVLMNSSKHFHGGKSPRIEPAHMDWAQNKMMVEALW